VQVDTAPATDFGSAPPTAPVDPNRPLRRAK
jgi:hypothetical protein